MKNLESVLRFGCPLIVEDVENIDQVLNPILNKEIRKTGGRILITLADQDVDFLLLSSSSWHLVIQRLISLLIFVQQSHSLTLL